MILFIQKEILLLLIWVHKSSTEQMKIYRDRLLFNDSTFETECDSMLYEKNIVFFPHVNENWNYISLLFWLSQKKSSQLLFGFTNDDDDDVVREWKKQVSSRRIEEKHKTNQKISWENSDHIEEKERKWEWKIKLQINNNERQVSHDKIILCKNKILCNSGLFNNDSIMRIKIRIFLHDKSHVFLVFFKTKIWNNLETFDLAINVIFF